MVIDQDSLNLKDFLPAVIVPLTEKCPDDSAKKISFYIRKMMLKWIHH
jgi:hypothetical protein